MPDTAELTAIPIVGRPISIHVGPLKDLVGTFKSHEGTRHLIELPDFGPGVYVAINAEFCVVENFG